MNRDRHPTHGHDHSHGMSRSSDQTEANRHSKAAYAAEKIAKTPKQHRDAADLHVAASKAHAKAGNDVTAKNHRRGAEMQRSIASDKLKGLPTGGFGKHESGWQRWRAKGGGKKP